ncbi:MAG TPA: hypothetical protein PLF61_03875, partial [Candidatus Goldiibacteriota bacterium]|nr:hypothetical protein [Candidatus Goldiibacteriota bacterium]
TVSASFYDAWKQNVEQYYKWNGNYNFWILTSILPMNTGLNRKKEIWTALLSITETDWGSLTIRRISSF